MFLTLAFFVLIEPISLFFLRGKLHRYARITLDATASFIVQCASLTVFKLLATALRFASSFPSSWPRCKGRWGRIPRSGFIVPYHATTLLMRSRRPYGPGFRDRGRDETSSSSSSFSSFPREP